MPQQGFDVNAARQAGYSDDEILSHLTATRNFDVAGAVSSGYSKSEIIDHLSGSPAQTDFAANPPGVPRPNVPMETMLTPSEFGNRLRNAQNPGVSEGAGLREGLSDYVTSSAGNVAGGAKDIAKGNVSKGAHPVIQGAGSATVPALPFLAPLLAANPAAAGSRCRPQPAAVRRWLGYS